MGAVFGLPRCHQLSLSPLQFAAAVEAAHAGKFTVALNDPTQLKRLSPSGTWRRGAFEVVRIDTGAVLYSKLGTGQHLVDGMSDKLASFVAGLAAEQ